MISIELLGKYGAWKTHNDNIFLIGNIFLGKEEINIEQLSVKLESAIKDDNLSHFLNTINGFYTIIFKSGNHELYILSDIVRSFPLFYSYNKKGQFLVSDYIERVFSPDDIVYNKTAITEFSKSGYVTGPDTFIESVFQTQAAEIVHQKDSNIIRSFYYNFYPLNSKGLDASKDIFFQGLNEALFNALQRLKTIAKDRQIVVPLSGGYDSRVLALYLKKTGFVNVVTFTFGSKDSPEVRVSRNVAKALSFDWHFVPYSNKKWARLKKDSVFLEYLQFVSSYSTLPNIMVFPAILELTRSGVIEKNAIVVPGHAGDYLIGMHIPKSLLEKGDDFQEAILMKAILKKHYYYSSSIPINERLQNKLKSQLALLSSSIGQGRNNISMAESWEWRERQTKLIANSNRYYDFMKLGWWMPLWDKELVDHWERTSLENRTDPNLWPEFIKSQFLEYLSSEEYDQKLTLAGPHKYVKKFKRNLAYFTHDFKILGFLPFREWLVAENRHSNRAVFQYLINNIFHLVYKNWYRNNN